MTGEFTDRERHQARRLLMVLLVVSLFFVAEFAGALVAQSDVLRLDAVHLLTDVAALAVALVAMRIAVRKPTARFTFGLRRAEPVAAIFNALVVLFFTGVVVVEGISDLRGSGQPRADIMLYVAVGALLINGLSAWLIHGAIDVAHAVEEERATIASPFAGRGHHHGPARHHHHDPPEHQHGEHHEHDEHHEHEHDEHHQHEHHERHEHHEHHEHGEHHGLADGQRPPPAPHSHSHSLNLRGALLHLLGDALGSFAALVAAILIKLGFSPKWDPIASFLVAAILVVGALRLLREAVLVLLEAAPPYLTVAEVRGAILDVRGVLGVHDLHVWSLGSGHDAITAHVLTSHASPALPGVIEDVLRRRFHAEYVTVQVETRETPCEQVDSEHGEPHQGKLRGAASP